MDQLRGYLNKLWVGLAIGIVGPWIGYTLIYIITQPDNSFVGAFLTAQKADLSAGIIAISSLLNLGFFLLAMQKNYLLAARGIILSTLVYAAIIVYLKYAA